MMSCLNEAFAGLYSIRQVNFAAYLVKRAARVLLKCSFFSRMSTALRVAILGIPPPPAPPSHLFRKFSILIVSWIDRLSDANRYFRGTTIESRRLRSDSHVV